MSVLVEIMVQVSVVLAQGELMVLQPTLSTLQPCVTPCLLPAPLVPAPTAAPVTNH